MPTQAPDPQLVAALRELVARPEEASDGSANIARNVDLTFCWANDSGIAIGDEAPPLVVDFPCRITGWTIAGKRSESGSASFTVYAGLYADFPTPVSIVASAPPAVVATHKAVGGIAAVSTWDSQIPRGSVLVAVADSVTTFTRLTLSLRARRLDL